MIKSIIYNSHEYFCFIFARGGSKSVKNKNLVNFNKKPLIANTILQAKRIKLINKIFVSTDQKNCKNCRKVWCNNSFYEA